MPRVVVFIDHSNVVHNLIKLRKQESTWVRWYDPLLLANHLARTHTLYKVYFYCAFPPIHLIVKDSHQADIYQKQLRYYERIKNMKCVNINFATLSGSKDLLQEKNLDTKLSVDMVVGASKSEYDLAFLVSNDGDYVAAVDAVKEFGKKVYVAYFKGSLSMHLSQHCHGHVKLRKSYFEELAL